MATSIRVPTCFHPDEPRGEYLRTQVRVAGRAHTAQHGDQLLAARTRTLFARERRSGSRQQTALTRAVGAQQPNGLRIGQRVLRRRRLLLRLRHPDRNVATWTVCLPPSMPDIGLQNVTIAADEANRHICTSWRHPVLDRLRQAVAWRRSARQVTKPGMLLKVSPAVEKTPCVYNMDDAVTEKVPANHAEARISFKCAVTLSRWRAVCPPVAACMGGTRWA